MRFLNDYDEFHTDFDAAVDRVAGIIAEGLSPIEAFDEIFGEDGGEGEINTYPMGKPTNKLHPVLFTICEDPHTLEKILMHIYKWLNDTDRLFPRRKVILFTDKWIPEALSRYQKAFRRFVRRGVTFDIRLTTDRGAVRIPMF
ncbi:MAG: hypothetical protein IKO74_06845 [Selenomonadaceae bacterium]|nr:hypothetical protein [Selenomonadaceae bacterium]